ncbi:AraC family transcriptional regulator [Aquitalea sp. S1-19]|nr:AraC family transcriptional regulator [Aquitalea sp. S1-19]
MSLHRLNPVLGFYSWQQQRLARVPVLSPMLICVVEGEKRVGSATGEWVCQAGQWLVLPGAQEVEMQNRPDPHTRHYRAWCHSIPRDWLARWLAHYGTALPARLPQSTPVFRPSVAATEAFSRFHALSVPDGMPLHAVRMEHAWQGLMLALAADGRGSALFSVAHGTVRDQVLALLAFDPAHGWSVDEMAGRLAMSAATLRRRLSQEDSSFSALLADVRMERALGLVSSSALPLLQVAHACGYSSPSRFSAAFRQRFGVAPRALRQAA